MWTLARCSACLLCSRCISCVYTHPHVYTLILICWQSYWYCAWWVLLTCNTNTVTLGCGRMNMSIHIVRRIGTHVVLRCGIHHMTLHISICLNLSIWIDRHIWIWLDRHIWIWLLGTHGVLRCGIQHMLYQYDTRHTDMTVYISPPTLLLTTHVDMCTHQYDSRHISMTTITICTHYHHHMYTPQSDSMHMIWLRQYNSTHANMTMYISTWLCIHTIHSLRARYAKSSSLPTSLLNTYVT